MKIQFQLFANRQFAASICNLSAGVNFPLNAPWNRQPLHHLHRLLLDVGLGIFQFGPFIDALVITGGFIFHPEFGTEPRLGDK